MCRFAMSVAESCITAKRGRDYADGFVWQGCRLAAECINAGSERR